MTTTAASILHRTLVFDSGGTQAVPPRASGGWRSEVKGESRAAPGSEDMSGAGHPMALAREYRALRWSN